MIGQLVLGVENTQQLFLLDNQEGGRGHGGWFLGDNDLQVALYDPTTDGFRDGLHPDRANENQGAESTLSFLT
jgi:hypothetical protein